jgi:hypothetical protein
MLCALGAAIAPPGARQALARPVSLGTERAIERGGLVIHHTQSDAGRAEATADLLAKVQAQVEAQLGLRVPLPIDVHLAPSERHFKDTMQALAGTQAPAWAQAVALPHASAVVIKARTLTVVGGDSLEQVLAHELAHMAMWGVSRELPRWANEGLAMWAAGQTLGPRELNGIARMAKLNLLPELVELEANFPPHAAEAQLAYQLSFAYCAWLAETYGDAGLRSVLRRVDRGATFSSAFERGLGVPLRGTELVFRGRLAERYRLWMDVVSTEALFAFAALLVIAAFVRHRIRRRRLLQQMDEDEAFEGGPHLRLVRRPRDAPSDVTDDVGEA